MLSFLAVLAFCSVMIIRQLEARQSRHVEYREAFILLQTGGYTNEAKVLYQHLLRGLPNLSNKSLVEDWQRTLPLVDPSANQPDNLIWRYHWTVRREMEVRAVNSIAQARKLADALN
jgi:hypothetical protein